jgi:histidine kinase
LIKKVTNKEEIKAEILKTLSEEIDSHVDRASKIISHMREFGRKSDVKKEKVDLNLPLTNALEIFRQQLKLRDINVIEQLNEDLPKVLGDTNRLEQVFINLLLNARDAIEEKWLGAAYGKADKTITLRTRADGNEVVVEVSDTGTGISKEISEKLFEPFFTTKKVGKGTGLGLSISYGIIQDYGGSIRTVSRSGGGASFIVTLPMATEAK